MKPIYENIEVAIDTSLKIAAYHHGEACKLSNWHIHREYELVYVKNGSGILRIGNKTQSYDDGTLVFLGPNIPHADFGNKDHADNLEVVIQFSKEFLEEKLKVFPEFKNFRFLTQRTKRVLLFDKEIQKSLSTEFERFDNANDAQRLILFITILERLAECESYQILLDHSNLKSLRTADVNRLETIFEYVNENYSGPISGQKLAEEIGLTTNSFCRFFKKMTNKTFVQFVNEFRTRKALELFNETTFTVAEVMYRCGYSDASYFSKQFKKHQGTTPSGYMSMTA